MKEQAEGKAGARALYREIMTYITSARAMVAKGEFIELGGLDKEVQRLCLQVQGLTPEEAKTFHTDLDQLMQELTTLQALFIESRDGLFANLTQVNTHKQAAMAYRHLEHSALAQGVLPKRHDEGDKDSSEGHS